MGLRIGLFMLSYAFFLASQACNSDSGQDSKPEALYFPNETCVVCFEGFDSEFNDRCILSCGHDLCQICLSTFRSLNSSEDYICPHCRAPITGIRIEGVIISNNSSEEQGSFLIVEALPFLSLLLWGAIGASGSEISDLASLEF